MKVDVPKLLEALGVDAIPRGQEYWARCPLHEGDRTPSWQMRCDPGADKHGLWRCYGCGKNGNAVQLVMALEDLTYREARAWIAKGCLERPAPIPARVVVDVEPEVPRFELPPGVVVTPMERWPFTVRRYAAKVASLRVLAPWQVDRWQIGYGASGLLAGRVVVPVRDARGVLCAYTARSFVGHERKYLEPTAKEGADISAVFGEEHWPAVEERALVVVTEGALNALAVERASSVLEAELDGRRVAVAAVRGSHLSPVRASRLATFQRVLVASDPDAAGDKVHEQIRAACGRWSNVHRVVFPEGTDAAELEQTHLERLLLDAMG